MNLIHFMTTKDPQYYEDCLSLAHLVYLPVSIMIGNAYCWVWLKRHIQRMLGYFHVCFVYRNSSTSTFKLCIYACLGILCSLPKMTVYVHCKFFWYMAFLVQRNTVEQMVLTYNIAFKMPWASNIMHPWEWIFNTESSALLIYNCLLNGRFSFPSRVELTLSTQWCHDITHYSPYAH